MNQEQRIIDTWFKECGWEYWSPEWILARLTEEVGEFARAVNDAYGPKQKKKSESMASVEDELGDILYTLACYANAHGINLDDALGKSIAKVKERDRDRF